MLRFILWFFLIFFTVSTASAENPFRVRLLALKHSRESMADGDANLALNAVKASAAKGLNIEEVGNLYVDRYETDVNAFFMDFGYDLDKFKAYIDERMKTHATPGDTFIVFTIGHGMPNGNLHNLGQRSDAMKIIASLAAANRQKTMWWQLSCYACAKLPKISDLTPEEQEYFTVYASSSSTEQSMAGVQGNIMKELFLALAADSKEIDPNQDGSVTCGELTNFFEGMRSGRGKLFFARNSSDTIFGLMSMANRIKIIDRNNPQREYPRDYIPLPQGR